MSETSRDPNEGPRTVTLDLNRASNPGPLCDRCGQGESRHSGIEKFCPFYSTFRAASVPVERTAPTPRTESDASRAAAMYAGECARLRQRVADLEAERDTASVPERASDGEPDERCEDHCGRPRSRKCVECTEAEYQADHPDCAACCPIGTLPPEAVEQRLREIEARLFSAKPAPFSLVDDLRWLITQLRSLSGSDDSERMDPELAVAMHAAVAAIYFADSADYVTALWAVVRALDPAMAMLLETDEPAAYEKARAAVNAARSVSSPVSTAQTTREAGKP